MFEYALTPNAWSVDFSPMTLPFVSPVRETRLLFAELLLLKWKKKSWLSSNRFHRQVVLPIMNDSGVVLPGAWYLFAVSAEGVPSVARTVWVEQA